jgi:hypothetical protein
MVPLPPRCPASRRRSPGTPIRLKALILYNLSLGKARCASAHVTPAAPAAGSPPQRARPPGGSTWPNPKVAPLRCRPAQGCSAAAAGCRPSPQTQAETAHVCTPAWGGASPTPPGAPRPHKSRTEAAPCEAEPLPVQRRVCKGRATARLHCATAAGSPSSQGCRSPVARTAQRPLRLLPRGEAAHVLAPAPESPTVLCDTGARAAAHRGSRHADCARRGLRWNGRHFPAESSPARRRLAVPPTVRAASQVRQKSPRTQEYEG